MFMEHIYYLHRFLFILFSLSIVLGSTVKERITPPDVKHPIGKQLRATADCRRSRVTEVRCLVDDLTLL